MAANSGRHGSPRRNAQAPQKPNEDRWEQIMQVIQEQTAVAANLVNHLAQIDGLVQPPPPEASNRVFFDFYKLKPPAFTGGHDPSEAQSWLDELNKIFEVVQCTDKQKVTFAAYMLKGAANNWWNLEKSCMMAKGKSVNWEHFQEVFLGRYFPECTRQQKSEEFTDLRQGGMSVAEYVAKFEELAWYYSPKEKVIIYQFKWGLRPEVKKTVSLVEFTSYTALVHESYIAEESLKKVQKERQLKRQHVSLTHNRY